MDLPSPESCFLSILPIILSGGPSYELDPALVSSQTSTHHRFLSANPSDPASYLFIAPDASLKGPEKLEQASQANGRTSDRPLRPEFHVEADGEVRSRVTIGSKLYCVLRFEAPTPGATAEKGNDEARWKFLTLTTGQDGLDWKPSPAEAFEAVMATGAQAGAALGIDIPAANKGSTQQMAEGEGTTPGAYGAANDFWAGYSSDEDEGPGAGAPLKRAPSSFEATKNEREEDDYWASYGAAASMIGGSRESSVISRRRSSTLRPSTTTNAGAPATLLTPPLSATQGSPPIPAAEAMPSATLATNVDEGLLKAMTGLWQMHRKTGTTLDESRESFMTAARLALATR